MAPKCAMGAKTHQNVEFEVLFGAKQKKNEKTITEEHVELKMVSSLNRLEMEYRNPPGAWTCVFPFSKKKTEK